MAFLILLSFAAALGIQLVSFRRLISRRGLDPSLLTYANPLSAKGFMAGRTLFIAALIISFLRLTAGRALWAFLLVSALVQTVILLVFNRQHTQPAGYYLLIAAGAAAGLLSLRPDRLIMSAALFTAGEMYMAGWNLSRQKRYDDWVKKCALKIHKRFGHLAAELEPGHWRWILHVAVTEHIARPAAVRLAERLYYHIKRPGRISTGIMQVAAARPMSDSQSLAAGSRQISDILARMPAGLEHSQQLRWLAKEYNGSYSYANYLHLTDKGVSRALEEIS